MRVALRRRTARVGEACHELRGALGALQLGLDLCVREGLAVRRMGALQLELERAAAALDDLCGRPRVIEPEAVCVVGLAGDCVETLRPLARRHGVRLELVDSPPAIVWGARVRLGQALSNLIENAIRHSGGTRVWVSARPAGDVVRVEVRDDGHGLSEPLHRLVSARARRRWAWLRAAWPLRAWLGPARHGHGLHVVAASAAAHGGRLLSAPSERGARMVLELPVAVPSADQIELA